MTRRPHFLATTIGPVVGVGLALASWSRVRADEPVNFQRDVAPILAANCQKCHGPDKQQGGLRFDNPEGFGQPGDSGLTPVVPGKPDDSELLRRISSTDDAVRMPPERERLSADQIDQLQRWVAEGAVRPAADNTTVGRQELKVTEADREFWSFRKLSSPPVPAGPFEGESRTEIDRLIAPGLAERGLQPVTSASPEKLVRRIYFDLVGLPPTPEQAADFTAAAAQDQATAVEELVDRLLASVHYGERWGRHWLDVARYADSDGQEGDQDRPYGWQYRDFVIKAHNDDLPFDQFVRWQIAGDELEPDSPLAVAATGFWVAGPHTVLDVPMEEEKTRNRYNELDDMLATLGSGVLGLSLGCARCHDHKYDPIPTRDYYRLLAAVETGDRDEAWVGTRDDIAGYERAHAAWRENRDTAQKKLDQWLAEHRDPVATRLREQKIAALAIADDQKTLWINDRDSDAAQKLEKEHGQAIAVTDDDARQAMDENERRAWNELSETLAAIAASEPAAPAKALVFREMTAEPKPAWLFRRANFFDRSEPVQLGFLSVLTSSRSADEYRQQALADRKIESSTYQRAALATWLTDLEHGAGALTARVIVNRVWQHHFGEGLVRTPNDFGTQGDRPAHASLLEWLAHNFVAHGWRLKRLHRQIMTTSAYARDTSADPARVELDPDNRLWSRRRPLRLEAEILRDAMLACAGTLNLEAFGPAFKPPISSDAMVARNVKNPYEAQSADDPAVRRRSVYMFHKRVIPYPLLATFDRPDAAASCGRRDATTVAPQALAMLNDQFVRGRAIEFADRLLHTAAGERESLVTAAFQIALGRPARASELAAATEFLSARQSERAGREPGLSESEAAREAVADFCQALFSLNEFLYVD